MSLCSGIRDLPMYSRQRERRHEVPGRVGNVVDNAQTVIARRAGASCGVGISLLVDQRSLGRNCHHTRRVFREMSWGDPTGACGTALYGTDHVMELGGCAPGTGASIDGNWAGISDGNGGRPDDRGWRLDGKGCLEERDMRREDTDGRLGLFLPMSLSISSALRFLEASVSSWGVGINVGWGAGILTAGHAVASYAFGNPPPRTRGCAACAGREPRLMLCSSSRQ